MFDSRPHWSRTVELWYGVALLPTTLLYLSFSATTLTTCLIGVGVPEFPHICSVVARVATSSSATKPAASAATRHARSTTPGRRSRADMLVPTVPPTSQP